MYVCLERINIFAKYKYSFMALAYILLLMKKLRVYISTLFKTFWVVNIVLHHEQPE